MREITLDELQAVVDRDEKAGLSKSSIQNDKSLMKALFRFAMERDIVMKDYSEFVELPSVGAKHEKGAFTDIQLKQIENLAAEGFPYADSVLMLCYTGFRITEIIKPPHFLPLNNILIFVHIYKNIIISRTKCSHFHFSCNLYVTSLQLTINFR